MPDKLSDEQEKVLVELANNLIAMDRVRRNIATALLWLSGIIVAGSLIWNQFSHLWSKSN